MHKFGIFRHSLMIATILAPSVAWGQVAFESSKATPLSDVDCSGVSAFMFGNENEKNPYFSNNPSCVTSGSRTISTNSEVRTGTTIDGNYSVDFNGTLAIDGVPTSQDQYGRTLGDATAIIKNRPIVTMSSRYTGIYSGRDINTVPASGNPANYAYFDSYANVEFDVQSIEFDSGNQIFSSYDGSESDYRYSLRSIDPTHIVNNGTQLAGRYEQHIRESSSLPSAVVFGKLVGTATVLGGNMQTPGQSVDGYYTSPFQMAYQVQAIETTRLDENGLKTPTISVTDSINMNGSKVRNLEAGTEVGDAVNKGQLDAEAQMRAEGDQQNAAAITSEARSRVAADNQLFGMVATEAFSRTQADLQLTQRIDNGDAERQALGQALASETSARLAADTALSGRVDALSGRLDQIDSRLGTLERKVAAGTAVAVALTGNTFLPDTHFNLTANVATYDGAHAGAMQVGALVSRNVALNAGVAKGFNKSGKTAGRVGFTVGW